MTAKPSPFPPGQLEAIAKALGDTDTGLSGSEIGHMLSQASIRDVDPNLTKWKRLYNALASRQNADKSGDRVLQFIHLALSPARYAGKRDLFEHRRSAVNVPLAFYGLEFTAEGKFRKCKPAENLGEAEQRAHRLRAALEQRGVEAEILEFCRAELLQDNYFHAVLEATKGVASKLRERTGLRSDGAELAQQALGGTPPVLRINELRNKTEDGEQKGFTNLVTGFFGTFRNPTAHAPRAEWPMPEQDALDLLSLASYILRRIKAAKLR